MTVKPIEISLKEDGLLLAVDAYLRSFQHDALSVAQFEPRRYSGHEGEACRTGLVAPLYAKLARRQVHGDAAPAPRGVCLQGFEDIMFVDHKFEVAPERVAYPERMPVAANPLGGRIEPYKCRL